jgi:hypothetical protein
MGSAVDVRVLPSSLSCSALSGLVILTSAFISAGLRLPPS